MKRKIVLWGTNEKEEKILVALHLKDKEGIVDLYTFDEEMATEDFYNAMLNQWRENAEVEMPDGHQVVQRPLSISDSILPDTVKVQRTDIIARAQTEWHFVVLSAKLYEMYRSELEDLSDTVENLKEYDNKIWTEMRNFWSKVQEQVNEKNLFRDHAATLKSKTNKMFDQLKTLKKHAESKYEETSTQYKETILTELGDIETKIEKGLGLKPIFEELKQLQSRLRGMKFTKKDRDMVWNKVDAAFKVVKEKRFGDKGNGNGQEGRSNAVSRHQGRLDGLENAIQKMEKSISRDKDDQKYQNRKIETTDGQLEMQIRQAKIKMIDERVRSKEIKLEDMYKTRSELKDKIVKAKAKEQKREEMAKAKATAEAKIASEVKKSAEIVEASADKLEEAVAKVAEGKKAAPITPVVLPNDEGAPAEAIKSTGSKIVEMPVKEVVIDNTKHTADSDPSSKSTDTPIGSQTKGSLLGAIGNTLGEAIEGIEDALEDVIDTVKAVAEVVEDKIEDAVEDIKERMTEEEEE